MKIKLKHQIIGGLVLVAVMYAIAGLLNAAVLINIAWTIVGLSFILHPILPERLPAG